MKEELLKSIAEAGYNVGFGAKKHFATYDIVNRIPGLINLFAISFGIYSLVFETLTAKSLSACILVLGVISLYVSLYEAKKNIYSEKGRTITVIFNSLSDLYRQVKSSSEHDDFRPFQAMLIELRDQFYEISESDQIFLSDWYAHYKFFWQHQIDWINEQKKFRLLRDKLPLSFSIIFILTVIVGLFMVFGFDLVGVACKNLVE